MPLRTKNAFRSSRSCSGTDRAGVWSGNEKGAKSPPKQLNSVYPESPRYRFRSLGIGPIKPPPLLPPTDRQELFVSSLAVVTFMFLFTLPRCPLAFLFALTLMTLVLLFALTLVALSSLSISLHIQLQ